MKYGMRKPSLRKSLSARTTGQLKRSIKRALIPGYGRRGMGWLHPKRALYNRVYRRTTFSIFDLFKPPRRKRSSEGSDIGCVVLLFLLSLICFALV